LKGVSIIKVFTIKETFDFKELQPFESVCDYYLFDTKGKLPGGNGYKFNWNVLKDYPSKKLFFLSGGIGLEDLESVKEFMTRPESRYCHAVDVNSRFEIKPGLKDIAKLREFLKSLR
jgi:phosphoribosylanthranilate isomerase